MENSSSACRLSRPAAPSWGRSGGSIDSQTRRRENEWFRYDAAFLRRYRLGALQDLARHLKIEGDGLKKGQLVAAILAHEGRPFLPVTCRPRAAVLLSDLQYPTAVLLH